MAQARGDAGLRAALVCFPLAVALLPGCGSGSSLSKEDYERRFVEATRRAESPGGGVKEPTSFPDAARFYEDVGRLTGQLRADLRQLEPPEEVARAHADYLDALGGIRYGTERLSKAASERDRNILVQGLSGVIPAQAARKARAARTAFQQRGYDLDLKPVP